MNIGMTQNRYILTWLLAALTSWCCLLASCSNADDDGQAPPPEPLGDPLTVSSLTRGVGDDNDVNLEGLTIWMMAVPTGPADGSGMQAGVISYNGPVESGTEITWNSAIYVKNDKQYEMFGFIPADVADETSSVTNTSYLEASLALNNLKPLSDKDVCLITGAIIACNDSLSPTDYLERGRYYYHPFFDGTNGDNQRYGVRLLADHLYASVKFNIFVNSEYNARRTIKLTKMELQTKTEKATVNASITLDKRPGTPTPFAFESTTGSGDESASVELFRDDEGQVIETESTYDKMSAEDKANYININPGYFGAWLYDDLYLVSTYDVYDKKGNLTRKECTAKNRLTSKLVSGTGEPLLKAGEQVTITLTVNPTYLYVLSDQELDNPTIVVE